MGQATEGRRSRRNNELLDAAEDMATDIGRIGYRLVSFAFNLLPAQSRRHMHNAYRELSYAFVELPGNFALGAGEAIERWAAEDDAPAVESAAATASIRRLRVADAPPAAAQSFGMSAAVEPAQAAPAGAATATGITITHIEFDPPGRDVDGEYVLIHNAAAAPAVLTGWSLHDGNARHTYTFPVFTLAPGAEVRLWTKRGADDSANLYWGQRQAVWNNDGDTGTLKDATGAVVSTLTYAGSK